MNVLVLAEGPTDDAVLRALVSIILGTPIDVFPRGRRVGGRAEVRRMLVPALSQAARNGVRHAVVGIDADDSVPHERHEGDHPRCDCCWFRREWRSLGLRSDLREIDIALAVPAPALEAWLLPSAHVIDVRPPGPAAAIDRREAKRLLYGTRTPTRADVDRAVTPVLASLDATSIERLAADQPSFRCFRDAVRRWVSAS